MAKNFIRFSEKRLMWVVFMVVLSLLGFTACSPLAFDDEVSSSNSSIASAITVVPTTTTVVTTTATTTATTEETTITTTTTTTTVPTTTTTTTRTTTTTTRATTKTTVASTTTKPKINLPVVSKFNIKNIPAFTSRAYVEINNNIPLFTNADYTTTSFERYSPLDSLGRCGVAFACIGRDIMPTEKRGEIGMIKPSGWHTVKYDCIADKYLYNRCHLIAYELSGEDANAQNLITGTRYLNMTGMLPFENMVADYVERSKNHVLYRVTPVFEGNNLVATGVLMEAYSVEDSGKGICFNVFCYNSQPYIQINYADGSSKQIGGFVMTTTESPTTTVGTPLPTSAGITYILNTNTGKFHKPDCLSIADIVAHNRKDVNWSRDEVLAAGFVPCKRCNP